MEKPSIAARPSAEDDTWQDGQFSRWLRMRPFILGRGTADAASVPGRHEGDARRADGHAMTLAIRQEAGRMFIGITCRNCGHAEFHPTPIRPSAN